MPSRTKSAPELAVVSPLGDKRILPPEITKVSLGPLDAVGIWQIAPQSSAATKENTPPSIAELACNLASPEESDLRVPKELLNQTQTPIAAANFLNRPIWLYLLFLAFFLFTVEWFLYHRRWIT